MKSKIHTIRITQYAIRTFRQLNNEKGWLFKGKTTKSSITFRTNKPNSPIVQMNTSLFITMIYAIFASLTKVKNKPNSKPIKTKQSQFKPNQSQSYCVGAYSRISSKYIIPAPPATGLFLLPRPRVIELTLARFTPWSANA